MNELQSWERKACDDGDDDRTKIANSPRSCRGEALGGNSGV